jgi:hypothetical protein
MRMRPSRPVLLATGLSVVLLGVAAPAVATTTRPATPSGAAAPAASRAAIPRPNAPHSGKVVPGVTGAAARKQDPPISASKRFSQLNAASHAATVPRPSVDGGDAGLRRSGDSTSAAKPNALKAWSGAFHGYWGTFPSQTIYGAQATQSLNPSIVAPTSGSQFIYSPTLDPSGIDTIEMSTIYDAGGNYVGAWDWGAAKPGFAKTAAINATFLATYTTLIGGRHFYTVQNVQTNATANTWTAYLFNYKTQSFDTFYTSSNTAKLSNSGGGWDMDEIYTDYNASTGEGDYCTLTKGDVFESTNLKYRLSSGGAWTSATTANSSMSPAYPRGSDLGCEDNSYTRITPNSALDFANNTHGADEIIGGQSAKCVDTNQVKFANGTKEQIYTCHGGAGQEWTYNTSGQLTVDSGKFCLTAKGAGTANGTIVDLNSCTGAEDQQWSLSLNDSLVEEQTGMCLEVAGSSKSNGGQLEIGTCVNGENQHWTWK